MYNLTKVVIHYLCVFNCLVYKFKNDKLLILLIIVKSVYFMFIDINDGNLKHVNKIII